MDGVHVDHDTPIDLPADSPDATPGAAPADELERADAAADAAPSAQGAATPPAEGAAELRDRWLRAEADLQNFRRRAARELDEARRSAEESVMLDVIESLDDLERALDAVPDEGAAAGWAAGVRLVAQRLRDSLARRGVTVMDPVGQPFDPTFHDALLQLPAPEGVVPGTVVQVALRGYQRNGRALRAARVVVARAAGEEG
jgi:molecular chaperone GrpE